MILLTKELAEARILARANFPDADFLPGDDPPVGATVYRANYSGVMEPMVVLSEFAGQDRHSQCGTCGHPTVEKQDSLRWFWRVDWICGDTRYEVLEWPSRLRRAA